MKIYVYDFDKTIYAGDSTLDFYFYALKKCPKILFQLPKQIFSMVLYLLRIYNKVQFKEKFYIFLRTILDVDALIDSFWEGNFYKIKGWYLEKNHDEDVIISASPEFLLEIPCRKLGVKLLIASRVNKNTGIYDGENCHGQEKVERLKKVYNDFKIEEFYSDSLSDLPLSKLANKSFMVKGRKITPWNTLNNKKLIGGDENASFK